MKRPTVRGVLWAALVGTLVGGGVGLYTRFQGVPVGLGGGAGGQGLLAVGSPEGGGGWITIYRGLDERPIARTRVPWAAYNDAVGSARPVPMRLAQGPDQQIVVALDAMPGQTGGWLVVLDSPERDCKPLAWKRIVFGEDKAAESLHVAGGDIDGDGLDEVVVGSPSAMGKLVVLADLAGGLAPLATLRVPWNDYNARCGETRPAVGDLDRDGRAEVVAGLGCWGGRAAWVAVFKDLRFASWAKIPEVPSDVEADGAWPSVGVDGEGKALLALGTEGCDEAHIAVVSDPLGAASAAWIDLPREVSERTPVLRPMCLDLRGGGATQVFAALPHREEGAIFDDATRGHAFLGWRRGATPEEAPGSTEVSSTDPGWEDRQAALNALRARRGEVEVSTGDDGILHIVEGTLSDPHPDWTPTQCAEAFLRENADIWGICDLSQDLAPDRENSVLELDEGKTTHLIYRQSVCGVPLLEGGLAVHMDEAGIVTMVTGEFDPLASGQQIDPTPRVSKQAAIEIVKGDARAQLVGELEPQLVAWRSRGPVSLCWAVTGTCVEASWARLYLVDAHTGKVTTVIDTTANSGTGTPALAFAHTTLEDDAGAYVTLDIERYDPPAVGNLPVFMWVDHRRRSATITTVEEGGYPMTHTWDPSGDQMIDGVLAWDGWMRPVLPLYDDRREAAAAHRNMGKVLAFWYDVMQRRSYDGRDGAVALWVGQVGDNGRGRDNAASAGGGQILINKRDKAASVPTLDVLAHEFTHKVVGSWHPHGWLLGEAGTIWEHIPDVFATFTEYHQHSETQERTGRFEEGLWQMMEEWGRDPAIASLQRDFTRRLDYANIQNPFALGAEADWGHRHSNAEVFDHWFYLWVHGGEHPWTDGRGLRHDSVRGMMGSGRTLAQAIWIAERTYWRFLTTYTRNIRLLTYEDFRRCMLASITNQSDRNEAIAAFRAIRLWPPYLDPWRITFLGPIATYPFVLPSADEVFSWTAVPDATEYILSIGSVPGGTDVFDTSVGMNLSRRVTDLPTDGRELFVRVWFRFGGGPYYYNEVTCRAAGSGGTGGRDNPPVMASPTPGTTLESTVVTFRWTPGTNVAQYRLLAGASAGGSEFANLDLGNALTATVSGLPSNGETVHVRLLYRRESSWQHCDARYTAVRVDGGGGGGAAPSITHPWPGSTLTWNSATFEWTAGTGVTQYRLSIGTNAGGNDVYSEEPTTGLSRSVGLPTGGQTLYVRLSYLRGNRWSFTDATYTAHREGGPAFFQPDQGTIYGTSATFEWRHSEGTQYILWVGRARGGHDLFSRNLGQDSSVLVFGLPTDLRRVHARLWYSTGDQWFRIDASWPWAPYRAPSIWSPTPGSRLTSFYARLQWNDGDNITRFWLRVGTTPGGRDIFDRDLGQSDSATIWNLPTDGRRLHVRLWYQALGEWRFRAATYWASNSGERPPAITDPPPGSMLASTATVSFTAGPSATRRVLHYATIPPAPDARWDFHPYDTGHYRDGGLDAGNNLSVRVPTLPTDHGPLYVWLTYETTDRLQGHTPYVTYIASHADSLAPQVTSPIPGSTCVSSGASSTITFDWSVPPGPFGLRAWPPGEYLNTGVTEKMWIGHTPRAEDWFDLTPGRSWFTDTSWTISNFPQDGRRMYVLLKARGSDVWPGEVIEYSMAAGGARGTSNDRQPIITSPVPGSTLASQAARFEWSGLPDPNSHGVSYHLRIGSVAGASDILDRHMGPALVADVTGLPLDGRTVYVRVLGWPHVSQAYLRAADFVYTAAGGNATPAMTSPAPGSTLTSSTVAFTWSPAAGATTYRLRVGSSPEGPPLYDRIEGTSRAAIVSGLPTDGGAVYVRLSYMTAGSWRDADSTYQAARTAVPPAGGVWAWGDGHDGQIGDGNNADRPSPVPVLDLANVTSLSAGMRFSLALKADGSVWAWGSNARVRTPGNLSGGMLGDDSTIDSSVLVRVANLTGVTAISAGHWYSLALRNDGTVWTWGSREDGVFPSGTGDGGDELVPRQIAGLPNIAAIAAGNCRSFALASDGRVWSWGGLATGAPAPTPDISGVTRISTGVGHALFLKEDGTVWRWGGDFVWSRDRDILSTPEQVPGLSGVTAIADGYEHSLALKTDGTVWAWGYNLYGEVGYGTTTECQTPVQASGLTEVVAIAASNYLSLALKADGTVWAWGNNQYGQLGGSSGRSSPVPVQVPGLQGITGIAAGGWHIVAFQRR